MKKINEMTIKEIRCWLESNECDVKRIIDLQRSDSRRGVQELVRKKLKGLAKEKQEQERLAKMLYYENSLWDKGYKHIVGVDEAGRGPLAGPVVAAAVILPERKIIPGIKDSKQINSSVREDLCRIIKEEALYFSVAVMEASYIDVHNIYQAGLEAMKRAVQGLQKADYVLSDAFTVPGISISQKPIKKGDTLSLSIASASILAKVTRDKIMEEYDQVYPEYGFSKHKGYATRCHFRAIAAYGPTPIHRRSFNLAFDEKDWNSRENSKKSLR